MIRIQLQGGGEFKIKGDTITYLDLLCQAHATCLGEVTEASTVGEEDRCFLVWDEGEELVAEVALLDGDYSDSKGTE